MVKDFNLLKKLKTSTTFYKRQSSSLISILKPYSFGLKECGWGRGGGGWGWRGGGGRVDACVRYSKEERT